MGFFQGCTDETLLVCFIYVAGEKRIGLVVLLLINKDTGLMHEQLVYSITYTYQIQLYKLVYVKPCITT